MHSAAPHSRLRRQYGVIHNVTARAVNIAENQMATIMIVGAYGNTPGRSLADEADACTSSADVRLIDRFVRHLRRRIMERYPRFRRLRFAPPAVMHGLPSPMAPRCGRRGVWQYAQKSLTETAESAEVGDRLTQIHWIYKIFLRKSAISARDYPCHLPCHTPLKVDESGSFGVFCKMTLWWSIIIIWRRSRRLRRIARSCAGNLLWCRSVMLMIRWSRILFSY